MLIRTQGVCHVFGGLRVVRADSPLDTFHLDPGVWLDRVGENPLVRILEDTQ